MSRAVTYVNISISEDWQGGFRYHYLLSIKEDKNHSAGFNGSEDNLVSAEAALDHCQGKIKQILEEQLET